MSANELSDESLSQIEEKISQCRAALRDMRIVTGSKEHTNFLKALADSLKAHHAVSHKFDVIEEAILVYDQVLQLQPIGHKQHAEAVHDVGNALLLFCLYHRIDATRARRCLLLLREALHWRPANHPLRDQSLYTLASALFYMNYDQGSGDLTALRECILLHREALQLRPVDHAERYKSLGQLATALLACFNHCGDVTLMVECIDMKREVLRLLQLGHRQRAGALEDLASALIDLAVLDGRLEALAEADSLFRESVALRPPGHPRHFCALDNLANSLHMRYELQGLPSALSESIALRREAYAELPGNHPDWSRVASNLAVSLIRNFRHQPDWSLIDEAITLLRRGIPLLPLGNAVRHTSLGNLAEALMVKFSQYKDTECLREAVALYREVLTLCPRGHLQRFEFLQSLGHLLTKPECQSWSEALVLFREAVESCSVGHAGARPSLLFNMSRCFLDPTSPFFDLPKGISCLSDGYANELSHVNQRLGHAITDLREVETAFTEATKGADTPTMLDHSRCILDLYTQVIGLLPRAANFGLDHKTRLQVLTGSDTIARNAAARALLVGSVVQAVELLEEGRGIFWSQTLRLRATGFDGIPDSDRAELLGLLRVLDHSARVSDTFDLTATQREEALERRRLLNKKVETVISRIRAYPELTRFLLPPAFQDLLDGLPNGFAVIVNASQIAHHALLLHKTTGLTVSLELEAPLKGFDFSALRARLPRDVGTQHERHDESPVRAMRLDSGRVNSFEEVMSQLWTLIVQPVIRKLGLKKAIGRARPRLWWSVTGELGFLPIHAAGKYQGADLSCTADYVVSSYIPTLSSLVKARNGWKPIPRSEIAGLLIGETYLGHASAEHLPGADKEVRLVRECFGSVQAHVLNALSPHISVADLRSLLEETPAHILHLACHGVQDADPLGSALLMHDGKFTIENMLQLNIPQAVLAYLSACQTAKGDKNAPDQAVHLAASMLFCGFRSVVGTMWLMHDEDGPKLARTFYEALFMHEVIDLDDIAYALDDAIQALRSQSVPAQRWALFMHMGG